MSSKLGPRQPPATPAQASQPADVSKAAAPPLSKSPSLKSLTDKLFEHVTQLSGKPPEKMRADILRLRDELTARRDSLLSGYMNRPASFFAYLNYHFPLHLPEAFWILEQQRAKLEGPIKAQGTADLSVLDVGCGPGTATVSLLLWLRHRGLPLPRSVQLFDISQKALGVASELIAAVAPPEAKLHVRKFRGALRENSRSIDGRYDWLLLSHVFNELGSGPRMRDRKLETLAALTRAKLKPGGFALVIEPPLREPTLDLMWIRDQIRADADLGLEIVAPCPAKVDLCPLAFEKKGWCYSQPARASIQAAGLAPWDRRLEKLLGIELTHPGFSYLLLRRPEGESLESDHGLGLSDASTRPGWVCVEGRNVRYRPRANEFRGEFLPGKGPTAAPAKGGAKAESERGAGPRSDRGAGPQGERERYTRSRPKRDPRKR